MSDFMPSWVAMKFRTSALSVAISRTISRMSLSDTLSVICAGARVYEMVDDTSRPWITARFETDLPPVTLEPRFRNIHPLHVQVDEHAIQADHGLKGLPWVSAIVLFVAFERLNISVL